MKTIKLRYEIKAPIAKVWQALVDPELIASWGGGPAKMSPDEETEFSLWGGDIWGKNLRVVPEHELIQEWYAGEWDEPSTLQVLLDSSETGTSVQLLHQNIPDNEAAEIERGWTEDYFGPLKELVEGLVK